jgi:pimeloyl-ACP methyl ester carboxylesterase
MQVDIQGKSAYAYTGGKAFDAKQRTIVFIHGAENDHSVWALQSRYFAHHGYSVIAVDLPGHGRSAGPALTSIEAIADWVATFVEAVGVEQVASVGHSMGSLITVELAARHPKQVSKIGLIGAGFPMRVSEELLEATRSAEPTAHDMINIWCHSGIAFYPNNPGPGTWIVGANLRLLQRQPKGTLQIDFKACNDYNAGLDSAGTVMCPALFLLGSRDVMTPSRSGRDFAKAFANATVITIPASGHAVMAEKPDEVLDALREFLVR